jgi:hypothetical protein
MKLTSILRPNVYQLSPSDIKTTVMAEDCTLAQAMTMVESWCYDNNATCPKMSDLWKDKSNITLKIITHDGKYINIFEITD